MAFEAEGSNLLSLISDLIDVYQPFRGSFSEDFSLLLSTALPIISAEGLQACFRRQ